MVTATTHFPVCRACGNNPKRGVELSLVDSSTPRQPLLCHHWLVVDRMLRVCFPRIMRAMFAGDARQTPI